MKRLFLAGVLVLSILLSNAGYAFAADHLQIDVGEYSADCKLYLDGQGVWIADQGTLYFLEHESQNAQRIGNTSAVEKICVGDDAVYIFTRENGGEIQGYSRQGILESRWAIEGMDVRRMVAADDYIVIAVAGEDDGHGYSLTPALKLYTLSKSTGEVSVNAIAEKVIDFTALTGNKIALLQQETAHDMHVATLDLDGGVYAYLFEDMYGSFFLAAERDESRFYLATLDSVRCVDRESGITQKIVSFAKEGIAYPAGMLVSGGKMAIPDLEQMAVHLFDPHESSGEKLTLVNVIEDPHIIAAVSAFESAHPNVEVSFIDMEHDTLLQVLEDEADGYDIIGLHTYNYAQLVRADRFVPLDRLIREADAWIPQVLRIAEFDGSIYGVIKNIFVDVLQLNGHAGTVYPMLEYNQALTWADLYRAYDETDLIAQGKPLLNDDFDMPYAVRQYISWQYDAFGSVKFDTDVFRQLMGDYRQAVEAGIIAESSDALMHITEWTPGMDSDSIRALARIEETIPSSPMQGSVICLNKHSGKPALGEAFIEALLTPDVQRKSFYGDVQYMFLKDYTAYDNDPWAIEFAEQDDALRNQVWGNAMILNLDHNLYIRCNSGVMRAYIEGKITLDELITELNGKS